MGLNCHHTYRVKSCCPTRFNRTHFLGLLRPHPYTKTEPSFVHPGSADTGAQIAEFFHNFVLASRNWAAPVGMQKSDEVEPVRIDHFDACLPTYKE